MYLRTNLKTLLLSLICFCMSAMSAQARDVVLQWDANTGSDIAGYKVYYAADSPATPFAGTGAVQGASPVDVKNQTTAALNGLDPNRTYYFAVTAYNTTGKESSYSNIVATDSPAISKSGWKLTYADSQELTGENGAAVNAFDGNTATFWVTQWSGQSAVLPHEIQIDLGAVYNLTSFSYLPRQDGNLNGTIAKYEFYVSADGATWGTAVSSGTFAGGAAEKKIFFAAKQGRHVRLRAISEINANPWTSLAEIGLFGAPAAVADTTPPTVSVVSPSAGAVVSGTTTIGMAASDDTGVSKVELYVNGALKYTGNAAPFSYGWNTSTAANGTYSLLAKAYDAAGNVGQSSTVSVTVANQLADATPPSVAINSPSSASVLTGTVAVDVSASDNVRVTKVELYVDGTLRQTSTASPFGLSWDTKTSSNGSHALSVRAYDAAGNVGQSGTVSVTVDNDLTPPSVAVSVPVSNSTVAGTTTVNVSAFDNVGVARVELYVDGTLLSSDTASPYAFTWNTTTSAEGNHILSAKAYDAAGNAGASATVAVTVMNKVVDTTAPAVSIASPVAGAAVSGSVTISAAASDNVGISKVELYIDGTIVGLYSTAPYTFAWNTTGVENGKHDVVAKAYDAAGNVGQSTTSVTVTNITAVPAGAFVAVFGNVTGSTYPNAAEDTYLGLNNVAQATAGNLNCYTWPANSPANAILMKWNVSGLPANAQIESAILQLYMTQAGGDSLYEMPVSEVINKTPVVAASTGYTFDGTNGWSPYSSAFGGVPLAQADIAAPVASAVVDNLPGYKSWDVTSLVQKWFAAPAGNRGLLVNSSSKATADSYRYFASSEAADGGLRPKLMITYTLAPDTTPPTVAVTAPSNNVTVTGRIAVSAAANDNLGVVKVEFYINGVLKSTGTSSPYSFAWDTTTVANGTYTVTAKAYDAAGNVSTPAGVSVAVNNPVPDTTAPTVSITSPAANASVIGTASVAVSAADNVGVAKVEFYANNVLTGTDTAAPYSFSWNTATGGNGTFVLMAKAYDAAGNVRQSASVSVTVNNPPIAIPKTNWKLVYADSQELVRQNGVAQNAFDGNRATYWITEWSTKSPVHPHEIRVDLGASYSISSFSYLPRQDGNLNGTIARYEFYVSSDGINWGTPVNTGTFARSAAEKKVTFTAKKGRYVRLRALSEVNGRAWTSVAELGVFGR